MKNKAYIALGTNIEPRYEYINQALTELGENKDIIVKMKSSIYETAPVGYVEQATFLNMVVEVETKLSSHDLLEVCQRIENQLGRTREIRFGPRTIDLDILVYNDENSKTDRLIIPHPRMHERAFVLIPFAEIAPNFVVPTCNESVTERLNKIPDTDKKDVLKWTPQGLGEE